MLVDPQSATSPSFGNWSELQITRPHLRTSEWETLKFKIYYVTQKRGCTPNQVMCLLETAKDLSQHYSRDNKSLQIGYWNINHSRNNISSRPFHQKQEETIHRVIIPRPLWWSLGPEWKSSCKFNTGACMSLLEQRVRGKPPQRKTIKERWMCWGWGLVGDSYRNKWGNRRNKGLQVGVQTSLGPNSDSATMISGKELTTNNFSIPRCKMRAIPTSTGLLRLNAVSEQRKCQYRVTTDTSFSALFYANRS